MRIYRNHILFCKRKKKKLILQLYKHLIISKPKGPKLNIDLRRTPASSVILCVTQSESDQSATPTDSTLASTVTLCVTQSESVQPATPTDYTCVHRHSLRDAKSVSPASDPHRLYICVQRLSLRDAKRIRPASDLHKTDYNIT